MLDFTSMYVCFSLLFFLFSFLIQLFLYFFPNYIILEISSVKPCWFPLKIFYFALFLNDSFAECSVFKYLVCMSLIMVNICILISIAAVTTTLTPVIFHLDDLSLLFVYLSLSLAVYSFILLNIDLDFFLLTRFEFLLN